MSHCIMPGQSPSLMQTKRHALPSQTSVPGALLESHFHDCGEHDVVQ
jgi:hypothetical protein